MISRQKIRQILPPVLAVAVLYLLMESIGITCPIKFMTGISCAGCGMSRAWISLLHLDIRRAFAFHPLFFTPPLFLLIYWKKDRLGQRVYKNLIFTFVILYVSVYIVRLWNRADDVVVFRPQDGLMFRILAMIKK